ncbi:MAG: hypothetical protein KatS3mg008_0223 [Acidimicrobiales bacterium]|nr:MAG: hypothetical protein KatS3mg008_0223 [Acidimicrobiales bacterium]
MAFVMALVLCEFPPVTASAATRPAVTRSLSAVVHLTLTASEEDAGPVVVPEVPDPFLPPELQRLPLRSRQLADLVRDWTEVKQRLDLTRALMERADTLLPSLRRLVEELRVQSVVWQRRRQTALARVRAARASARRYAVAAYLDRARGAPAIDDPTDLKGVLAKKKRTTYFDSGADRWLTELSDAKARLVEAEDSLSRLRGHSHVASSTLGDLESFRRRVSLAFFLLSLRLEELSARVGEERRVSLVEGTDMPLVALEAYWNAAARMSIVRPSCRIRWSHLAAIGRVESRHGRWRGSAPRPDGRVDPPVRGPRLDGSRWAAIPDTDDGSLDGDPIWDRAVGPMQFIPSSWRRFGEDTDGDGRADPDDLHDAAWAAARHLCRGRSGLDRPEVFGQALLGYNRSSDYAVEVLAFEAAYSRLDDLLTRSAAEYAESAAQILRR